MWPFGGVGASFSGPFTRNLGLASRAPNKVVGPSVRRNTAFGSRLLQRHRMFLSQLSSLRLPYLCF